jgi:hypothetical protein
LNKETFLIFNDESREIYVCFNRVLMFHIRILDKTFINQKKCAKALRTLKKGWEIVLMHAFDVHFFACVFLLSFAGRHQCCQGRRTLCTCMKKACKAGRRGGKALRAEAVIILFFRACAGAYRVRMM